jgi:hypothetical protein
LLAFFIAFGESMIMITMMLSRLIHERRCFP